MPEELLSKIERIHPIAKTFSHIATVIVAVIAGFFGYYSTIYIKKEREIAEYTLKELDLKTTQKPHIQAKIEATVQPLMDGKNLLLVQVTLSNLGNKESKVILDDHAITLVPVIFSQGKPIYQNPINLKSGRYMGTLSRTALNFMNIGAGESHEITFVQKLENPGVYLIHFLALNDTPPREEDFSITGGIPYKYAVGADQYVVVK